MIFLVILAALIGVPLLEIAILIEAGSWFGVFATLAAIVLTAVIGTALVRAQGLATLFRFRQRVEEGETPAEELIGGLCLVIAGVLLLAPGFITDTIGFTLLIPPLRQQIAAYALRKVAFRRSSGAPGPDGTVIDGQYREVNAPPLDHRNRNGKG